MRFNPKKILVATDFSVHARAAADAAGAIARAFEGSVWLLHVVPLNIYVDVATHLDARTFSPERFRDEVQKRAQAEGALEVARLCEDGVYAAFRTVDGPPAVEIARIAREDGFDLVVMSTHGRTGLLRLTMGSVAESVVRLSTVATLCVRADEAARA